MLRVLLGSVLREISCWCDEMQFQYIDATLVADHIEKADHYHGRTTVANVTKLASFFTSLLHFMMQQKKFKRYEAAFDSLRMIGRKLVLSYTDAVELTDETHAAAQKAVVHQTQGKGDWHCYQAAWS